MSHPRSLLFIFLAALTLLGGVVGARGANGVVPVLFVPGYAASTPRAGEVANFAFKRGAAPQQLQLSLSYDLLVHSLTAAGYREGKTFFGAVYDWRMAAAPVDGTPDGNLQLVTADSLTRGDFSYAVNYLGYWLDQAVQANPDLEYVDVVSHDAGGVLVRAYIQSPAYGAIYKDRYGRKQHLPKIRNLILGACPNEGTVHSWRPWGGDFQDVLGGSLPTSVIEARFAALAFAYVSSGSTIAGPDHVITPAMIRSATKDGQTAPDEAKFFALYAPLRQSLMPTGDFLTRAGTDVPVNVNADPTRRSDLLLDLNAGSTPGHNPWATLVGQKKKGGVLVTFASGARDKTGWRDFSTPGLIEKGPYIQTLNSITQLDAEDGDFLPLLKLLTQAHPVAVSVVESLCPRVGDEELKAPLAGDGDAPFTSTLSTFAGDPNVSLAQWGNGDVPASLPPHFAWTHLTDYPVYHDVFFFNPQVRSFVIGVLTGSAPRDLSPTNSEVDDLKKFLGGQDRNFDRQEWQKAVRLIGRDMSPIFKESILAP